MKIQCQTRELLDAVNLVAGVVASNTTRPILLSVFLSADEDGLVLQGTDLELGLSVRVDEVEVETPGILAIPANRLHAILRETPHETVSLELAPGENQVAIRAGSSRFKVPAEGADEFPRLEFKPPAGSLRTSRESFASLLRRVAVAAAKDATRFQMHSVLLDCRGGALRLVSTDGKRLALGSCVVTSGSGEAVREGQYILPMKAVDLLTRILPAETVDDIELHLDRTNVTYTSDRISLSCGLVEGNFPEYERALPPEGNVTYEIEGPDLLQALRQAALMTTKETNSVQFKFSGDRLVLSTRAVDLGESRIEIEVKPVSPPDEEFPINFNPGYLMDLLKVLGPAVIRGNFSDRKTAGIFTIVGGDESYRHIVMPLVSQE